MTDKNSSEFDENVRLLSNALDGGNDDPGEPADDSLSDIYEVEDDDGPANGPPKLRERGPDGKFAKEAEKPEVEAPVDAAAPVEKPVEAVAVEPVAATPGTDARPPPGWSPASKVAFDALPPSVKADIAKREVEVNAGLAKLADYRPIDRYNEMAKQSGTTLEKALDAYVGMEKMLRTDVFAGFEAIMRNAGVNPAAMAQAYMARQHGDGQQAPEGHQVPIQRQPAPLDQDALIRRAVETMRAEQQQADIASQVQKFAANPANRFFENVKPLMSAIINSGQTDDLQTAYDMACRAHPEVSPLINQQAAPVVNTQKLAQAATQARQASKSVTGSPVAGGRPVKEPAFSIHDELSKNWDALTS